MTTKQLIEWVELAEKKREESFKRDSCTYGLSRGAALDLIITTVKPQSWDREIALCLLVNYSDWH